MKLYKIECYRCGKYIALNVCAKDENEAYYIFKRFLKRYEVE